MQDLLKEKIYVDEQCEQLISIASRQYKIISVIGICLAIVSLINQGISYFKYAEQAFHKWINIFNFRIYPLMVVLQLGLVLAHLYIAYTAIGYQKNGLAESNQALFNKSFNYYRIGNNVSIIQIMIALAYQSVFLFEKTFAGVH